MAPLRFSIVAAFGSCALVIAGCGPGAESSGPGTAGSSGTAGTAAGGGGTGAADSGGAGTTDSGGAGAGGDTGGGGTGGSASFDGYSRVDKDNGSAVAGSAEAGIAPDGTIYVTWVGEQNGQRDVHVARSSDGGKSFEAAVVLDDASITPLVSMARHPYVEANNERVAVVFNDQAGTVYLYVSPAGGALSFGAPTHVGKDISTTFRDFPKPLFLPDGKLAVVWQGYPMSGARIFVSRESAGYATEEASGGAPGVPCECCPQDITATGAGDVLVAFRNNDNNIREMWFAGAPAGGSFSQWAAISKSEGTVNACPMQGPRLAQVGPKEHLAVWSVRGAMDAGAVYMAKSTDGGMTWSGGAPLGGFIADEPTIAVSSSGRIFVTGVTGNGASSMVYADDPAGPWSSPEKLMVADGSLGVPQAQGGGGVAALAGVSKAGTVWLRRMQ